MTTQEMRELDAWIAENVMGETIHPDNPEFACTLDYKKALSGLVVQGISYPIPQYTTDPAAAMEVLKKCAEVLDGTIRLGECGGRWFVFPYLQTPEEARDDFKTLELAICRFAKQLFTKESK